MGSDNKYYLKVLKNINIKRLLRINKKPSVQLLAAPDGGVVYQLPEKVLLCYERYDNSFIV